jgi:4-nitrophenyl phosphatase
MAGLLDRYKGFIIDLDGVVYLLDDPIPGSREVIKRLQSEGAPFVFLTNNSVATPQQYAERLARFGLRVLPEDVVSSCQAVARYLEMNCETDGRTAFVIGEDGLLAEASGRGLRIVEGEEAKQADFVFVGWDRRFDFEKLKLAVVAIRNGACYIATNADATYPTPEGLWPGAGSIVAAVTTGSGHEPVVAGKPNPLIVELALARMGLAATEALLIGDRLDTDIKAGLDAGVDTMLVLTGVSSEYDIEETGIRPTYTGADLRALLEL